MLGQGGEIRNAHHWVLDLPYPVRTLAALLSAGRAVLGGQSTASELPASCYIKPREVARDFLGPGVLPDGEFVSSDAFLPCGWEMGWYGSEREGKEKKG